MDFFSGETIDDVPKTGDAIEDEVTDEETDLLGIESEGEDDEIPTFDEEHEDEE